MSFCVSEFYMSLMRQKRHLEKPTLLGHLAAENVLEWLSSEREESIEPAAKARIARIIENFQQLMDTPKTMVETAVAINRQLARYPAYPVQMWDPSGAIVFGHEFPNRRVARYDEAAIAYSVVRLVEFGLL